MDKFFQWLDANNFQYTRGDVHWAGAGWWYPSLPDISTGAEAPKPPAPWIHVEKDRENDAVFIGSSYAESVYAETPARAQTAVETLLMQFDEQAGGSMGRFRGMEEDRVAAINAQLNTTRRARTNAEAADENRGDWYCAWDGAGNPGASKTCRACGRPKGTKLEHGPFRPIDHRKIEKEWRERASRRAAGLEGLNEPQFPKSCSCGVIYDVVEWNELPWVGEQEIEAGGPDEPAEVWEARNCPSCDSTLMVNKNAR